MANKWRWANEPTKAMRRGFSDGRSNRTDIVRPYGRRLAFHSCSACSPSSALPLCRSFEAYLRGYELGCKARMEVEG